jgi:hypothetical protein
LRFQIIATSVPAYDINCSLACSLPFKATCVEQFVSATCLCHEVGPEARVKTAKIKLNRWKTRFAGACMVAGSVACV